MKSHQKTCRPFLIWLFLSFTLGAFQEVSGQNTIELNPGINPSKYVICAGETVTLTISTAATLTGALLSSITTEDVRSEFYNCYYSGCTVVKNIVPEVVGDGVISKDVIVRKGCNQDPTVRSIIEIKVKPTVTTTYRVFWKANIIWGADPLCGTSEQIVQTQIYDGSIEIKVVQPDPPVLTPGDIVVNQFDNSKYITATADFITNSRGIRWYITECDNERIEQINFHQGNTMTYSVNANKLGITKLRASKIDDGCISAISDPVTLTVKPCQLFNSGCNLEAVNFIESNSCNPAAAKRTDYHFYENEQEVCSNACDIDMLWNKYKLSLGNQVPNLADQLMSTRFATYAKNTLFNKLFFTEPDNSTRRITDCAEAFLPRPTTYVMGMAYQWDVGVGNAMLLGQSILTTNPLSDRDQVFIRVDEARKCVVNYTKPDHALYPGKVTRCLVEECGVVKIKTFGEGVTRFGDGDLRGKVVGKINDLWGDAMFRNVSKRANLNLNQPRLALQNPQPMLPALINKNWKIKSLAIQYPESDSLYQFYDINDTTNFLGLRNLNVTFLDSNKYIGLDISGEQAEGNWSFDSGSDKLHTDTSEADVVEITDSSFSIKQKFPVLKLDTLKTALVYIQFVRKEFDSSTYTFIGSGSWDDHTNWLQNKKPPHYITYGTTVKIEPISPSALCIYTGDLYISKGAKILVKDGVQLKVTGRIELK